MKYHHSTEKAEVRKRLLANGYAPLPLDGKQIFEPGWTKQEITLDWLARFARSGRYANTGLRCDNLLAFDIDVYDELLADKCEAFIEQHAGETAFCRIGQWPKRTLLYRGEGGKSGRTGNYADHMVELLATPGRQMAGYGTHPKTGEEFEWEDKHPAANHIDEIPALTEAKAQEILKGVDELLADSGYALKRRPHMRGHSASDEYDMQPDTLVEVGGKHIAWGDLIPDLTLDGVFGNLYRPEYDDWGDSNAVHFYLTFGMKEPAAHDFVNDCTHYSSMFNAQFAALLPPPPTTKDQFTPDDMAQMAEDAVLLKDGTLRLLSDPTRAFKLSDWRQSIKHLTVPHPNDPRKTIEYFVSWQQDKKTQRASYAELRPDYAPGLFKEGPHSIMNTYNPPDWDAKTGGESDTFYEFLEHLLPNESECLLFDGWLSNKVRNPHQRMHGMMMVTPEQGTGRGTLGRIMSKLFGGAYYKKVEIGDLVGTGSGQSAFNAYLADSLIVYVAEALETREDVTNWHTRHAAYEQLKTVMELDDDPIHIKRKYGMNTHERSFASILISSNWVDALAIPPGDRRLIVLDNCEVKLEDAPRNLHERINAWMQDDRNIAALHRELMVPASSYNPYTTAPMTPAKERMIESAQSDIDKLFADFVIEADGDLATTLQWTRWAQQQATARGMQLPSDPVRKKSGLERHMANKCRRIDSMPVGGYSVNGAKGVRPWIMRNMSKWRGSIDRDAIRRELLKNGDPAAKVIKLPDR